MPDRGTMAGAAVRSRQKKKQRLSTGQKVALTLAVLIVLGGATALAYPTFSQWWNARDQSAVVADYAQEICCLDDTDAEEQLQRARDYNRNLTDVVGASDPFASESAVDTADYNTLLWATQEGVMAYVEIPKIGVLLPIYHGVGSDVLMKGVGHMPETSLPVGGESTHCVLAGHSGMTHARLFTDLDQMQRGDVFYITVLGELLVYQVDQVVVVLPHEMEYLDAVEGEDYCTLVTCTPYGINTHRLLVRGRRTELADISQLLAMGDGVEDIKGWQSAMVCAAPVALVGMLLMLFIRPKRRFR